MKKEDTVDASPTKEFFTRMLTRDLSLTDAILDLIDNCVDGAIRQPGSGSKKFKGKIAEIKITGSSFTISDNCGGIPDSSIDYAFRHGRPYKQVQDSPGTVGFYGIGLKRSIYKIGNEAEVVTQNENVKITVSFTSKWMTDDTWDLPLKRSKRGSDPNGTTVKINNFKPDVVNEIGGSISEFIDELKIRIGTSFAYVLSQGFQIKVNNEVVKGKPISLTFDDSKKSGALLRPFLWQKDFGKVKAFLAVGYYAPAMTADEIEDHESESINYSSETSGWTVLCNQRVVAYCDRTHLTGWGESPIPRFHTQYTRIRGIVTFESDDVSLLPTTTTKRGIDLSNIYYAEVKNVMKQGVRMFIDNTNVWKKSSPDARNEFFPRTLKQVDVDNLKSLHKSVAKIMKGDRSTSVFKPELPKPKSANSDKQIRFTRPLAHIEKVRRKLKLDDLADASEVGAAAFDYFTR